MSDRDATVLMIGETLLVLQKFERFLAAVLMTMMTPADVDAKLGMALLRDKETLGRLMSYFAVRTELPDRFAETFDVLLERRNVFIHSLFMQPWFNLKTSEGRARLDTYLTGIRGAARTALHIMIGALDGGRPAELRTKESQGYIDKIVLRIRETGEPNFGGLTEEQYTAKVIADAHETVTGKPRDA
jgi:hypothetical protein